MNAYRTKTFKSGNSTAVRLPKELEIEPGVEVEIERNGRDFTIRRKRMTTKEMIEALNRLPKPSYVEVREPIEFPDRPGL